MKLDEIVLSDYISIEHYVKLAWYQSEVEISYWRPEKTPLRHFSCWLVINFLGKMTSSFFKVEEKLNDTS